MIVAKNIVGSFIGTLIAVWFSRWLGWIPSYDFAAERYFVENWRELSMGILTLGLVAVLACMFSMMVYALWRLLMSIK